MKSQLKELFTGFTDCFLAIEDVIITDKNIKFTFMNAFGVESDLNEFSGGIISDVIYSPVE